MRRPTKRGGEEGARLWKPRWSRQSSSSLVRALGVPASSQQRAPLVARIVQIHEFPVVPRRGEALLSSPLLQHCVGVAAVELGLRFGKIIVRNFLNVSIIVSTARNQFDLIALLLPNFQSEAFVDQPKGVLLHNDLLIINKVRFGNQLVFTAPA